MNKKIRRLEIKLNEHEYNTIERKWLQSGKPSRSDYLRELAIHGKIIKIDLKHQAELTSGFDELTKEITALNHKINVLIDQKDKIEPTVQSELQNELKAIHAILDYYGVTLIKNVRPVFQLIKDLNGDDC